MNSIINTNIFSFISLQYTKYVSYEISQNSKHRKAH
jgi:hypothetical protein